MGLVLEAFEGDSVCSSSIRKVVSNVALAVVSAVLRVLRILENAKWLLLLLLLLLSNHGSFNIRYKV